MAEAMARLTDMTASLRYRDRAVLLAVILATLSRSAEPVPNNGTR